MIPLKLSLKNFLCYGDNNPPLDFREFNVACFSGKNGHGKSALIDAITWALWERCRIKSKEEIIRRGSGEAVVEFEFEVDGNRYRILRAITRKRGSATSASVELQVFDAGNEGFRPLAQGRRAQEAIERILKMDYDSFICSSFILQGRADEFTKMAPSERKDVLGKILELEKYEKAAKKAKEFAQKLRLEEESLRGRANQLESEISGGDGLKKNLEEVKAEEEKIIRELGEAERSYEVAIRESEALNAKIEVYNRLIQDKKESEENYTKLEEELKRLAGEMERYGRITRREEEIARGYEGLERAREKERVFSEKLILYTNLIKELEELKRLVNDEKSKIQQKMSSLRGKKEELERRLVQVRELVEMEEEIKAGFNEFLRARALEKEFEEKKQVLETLKPKKMELENSVQKIRFQIEAQTEGLKAKVKELSKRAEGAEKFNEECEMLRARIKAGEEGQVKCESLKVEFKEIGEERKALTSKKSETQKRQREEAEKLSVIKSQADKPHCPLCESPLGKEAKEALLKKLEDSIFELEETVKEENKRIGQMEGDEKRVSLEIKKIESEVRRLPELSKQLGEREKSLLDSISASKDLEPIREELGRLKDMIEEEDFGVEFRGELKRLTGEIERLNYDGREHKEIKERLESLRSFQAKNELLQREKSSKSEIEVELARVQSEITPLTRALEEGLFAVEYKERALKIQGRIGGVGYDGEKHKGLKTALKDLEKFSLEKENLDKAKLDLSLKQRERGSLEERLNAEKDRFLKVGKEIERLEKIVGQSKALEEKKRAIQGEISRLKRDKDGVLGEKSRILNELQRLVKLEGEREEALKQMGKVSYDLTVYQELDRAFGKNGIQALIIENAVPEIEVEANGILRKLTEGVMSLSLEMVKPTQKGTEKETLDIKIADSSGTRSYETYSGGETFRIDFALRVAISKFIANCSGANLRTLVVDEGFGTQDKDGLSQFIQVINTIKDDFDKILVITHVDELKDKFPVRIEVAKEPGRGSSFEVVYS